MNKYKVQIECWRIERCEECPFYFDITEEICTYYGKSLVKHYEKPPFCFLVYVQTQEEEPTTEDENRPTQKELEAKG